MEPSNKTTGAGVEADVPGQAAANRSDLDRRELLLGLVGLGCIGLCAACGEKAGQRAPGAWLGRLPNDRRRTFGAVVEHLLPGAVDAGALDFIDAQLSRPPFAAFGHQFDMAALLLNRAGLQRFRKPFADCGLEERDQLLRELRHGGLHANFDGRSFIERVTTLTLESYLGDPKHGGNKNGVGWDFIGWKPCWWSPHNRPSAGHAGHHPMF